MKYLPYEHLLLKTTLSKDEIINRLENIVESKKFRLLGVNKPQKKFEGIIAGNLFKISRNIKGRNSFLPEIEGEITTENLENFIDLKMKLNFLVALFLIFCIGFILIIVIVGSLLSDEGLGPNLMALFMLAFIYGLTMFGFKIESTKSINAFVKLFEAEIITKGKNNLV